MNRVRSSRFAKTLLVGTYAGIAGGLAEIGWIALYGTVTGASTEPVARGVVASVIPALAASSWSPWLGVLIHLGLAIGLGLGLALALQLFTRDGQAGDFTFGAVILALAAVWAVNFFVALPRINPEFVRLLPYGVTLLSKLLFGLSAAAVFRADRRRRVQVARR